MNAGSPNSKTPQARDTSELDGSQGYVTASEVRNAWIEWIRKLDAEVWPKNRTPTREEIIELFESLQYRLLTRAQTRIPQNPARIPPKNTPESSETNRAEYDARQARLSKFK